MSLAWIFLYDLALYALAEFSLQFRLAHFQYRIKVSELMSSLKSARGVFSSMNIRGRVGERG